jgi:hypothetical protein
MPRWFLRFIGHWFDPDKDKAQRKNTDIAVAKAAQRRQKAELAIEEYRRIRTLHRP